MDIVYRVATVGFCLDLTHPESESMPIAVLLMGAQKGAGEGFAAVAAAGLDGLDDPFAAAMLQDVGGLLRRHVDDALRDRESVRFDETGAILDGLRDSLRNSLHVQSISEPISGEIDSDAPLESGVIAVALQHLTQAVRQWDGRHSSPPAKAVKRSARPVQAWPLAACPA